MFKHNSTDYPTEIQAQPDLPLQERNFLVLGQKIKNGNFSKSDHIFFLESEIIEQLAFIKSNLLSEDQHKIFTLFQDEFEQRKQKKLNYEWWIHFCYRLSILVTTEENRQFWSIGRPLQEDRFKKSVLQNNAWHHHNEFFRLSEEYDSPLQSLTQRFPEVILIPSTAGDIRISDFNNALLYHVMPLGLIGSAITADGEIFQPDRFFLHDIAHAVNWFSFQAAFYPSFRLFLQYILEKIQNENSEKRRAQLHLMVFQITHEEIGFINLIAPILYQNISTIECFKRDILRGNRDGNYYELCLNDSWYAPLIKPNLSIGKDQVAETIDYIDQAISLMGEHIERFFKFFKINHFSKQINFSHYYSLKKYLNHSIESISNEALFDLRNYSGKYGLEKHIAFETPANATHLDLSWNKLGENTLMKRIEINSVFSLIPYQITKIDLSHNKLNQLSYKVMLSLKGLLPDLEVVYMSYDEINLMSAQQIEALKAIFLNTRQIILLNYYGEELDINFESIFQSRASESGLYSNAHQKALFFQKPDQDIVTSQFFINSGLN